MDRLKIFTWHIHGSYLYYLLRTPHDFYVPVLPGRPERYAGKTASYQWPDNLHEVPAAQVAAQKFDCILYQHSQNYLKDQYQILSENQRRLPRVYLEHDPPQGAPTETRHVAADRDLLLVHVTHFNALMWNSGRTRVRVVEHGVAFPATPTYTGEKERGIVVVNNMLKRGRRLGHDIYLQARSQVPLDLIGMQWRDVAGGVGEVLNGDLAPFLGQYRFFFNPIRYTSLGLAVLEAMGCGLPIVGLATTEMVHTIENGVNGFLSTDPDELISFMRDLLADREKAGCLGRAARRTVEQRFNLERFAADWRECFEQVCGGEGP